MFLYFCNGDKLDFVQAKSFFFFWHNALKISKLKYVGLGEYYLFKLKNPYVNFIEVHTCIVYQWLLISSPFMFCFRYLLGSFPDGHPARREAIHQMSTFALQICDSLAYAHEKGYTHRDLKMENILVCCALWYVGEASAFIVMNEWRNIHVKSV